MTLAGLLGEPAAIWGFARSLMIYLGRPGRAAAERRFYRQFVGPGDLVFDIGAHVGNRSRSLQALGARVVAVEPQPRFAAWLDWLFRAQPQVTVHRCALSAQAGSARLALSRRHPTLATLDRSWQSQVAMVPGFSHVRWESDLEVPVETLDRLIARHGMPAFCKIDVEGHEAEVLSGLSAALPALSFEYTPGVPETAFACIGRLERLGRYRYAASPGETLELGAWSDAGELRAWLAARERSECSGDIYALLEGP
ncbi:FkbM family methyltransferase [Algihabitans albus]|uniref:FkbM family methyltransferase n=1 Tax=Algihabitans albus TaxID=2164067 RepID=UPI000E5D35B8|nr:FkbM family methyltransferase [Algihabitans albus]